MSGRIEFVESSMAVNVRDGGHQVFVLGRGWVRPSSLVPGDRISLHDPSRPGSCLTVSRVSPSCPACGRVPGGSPSCPSCPVAEVMES